MQQHLRPHLLRLEGLRRHDRQDAEAVERLRVHLLQGASMSYYRVHRLISDRKWLRAALRKRRKVRRTDSAAKK